MISHYDQTIYAVVAACLLPIILSIISKVLGGFTFADNEHPRDFLAKTTGASARANAAQMNGLEILPLFIASVLFGLYCVIPQESLTYLAWFFVAIRIAYSFAYIFNLSIFRSLLWILSVTCPLLIFKLCLVG